MKKLVKLIGFVTKLMTSGGQNDKFKDRLLFIIKNFKRMKDLSECYVEPFVVREREQRIVDGYVDDTILAGDYEVRYCDSYYGIYLPREIVEFHFDELIEVNLEKCTKIGRIKSFFPLFRGEDIIAYECSRMKIRAYFHELSGQWLGCDLLVVLLSSKDGSIKPRSLILRECFDYLYFYDLELGKLYKNFEFGENLMKDFARAIFGEKVIEAQFDEDRNVRLFLSWNDDHHQIATSDFEQFADFLNAEKWEISHEADNMTITFFKHH